MCRNIRDRREPNKIVTHITARTVEGLPFVPRLTINMAIKGILAKAQSLYPITICAFLFMGNHHHFILAGNGNRISDFMEYMQGELSKTFKRFIPGKYPGKFWKDRFREQRLGSPEAVIQKFIYIFSNPLEASLVTSIKDYPGINSFHALKNSKHSKCYSELAPRLPVRHCKPLTPNYSRKDDMASAKELIKQTEGYYELTVCPFAWLKCFEGNLDEDSIRERILSVIQEIERQKSKLPVYGPERLKAIYLRQVYKSKKSSPTPYIDCPDPVLRKELIKSYQIFRETCREAWIRIKNGIDAVWPQGAFMPYRLFRPLATTV